MKFVLVALVALAGCAEDGSFQMPSLGSAGDADTAGALAPFAAQGEERDVEAPEVFSVTDNGLWDGRPSLGGVWVAHPDVTDPERVIIRNDANGKFVIGALFRRERDNPGPALQVSSDAATELGLLAGAPTRLNVVALRRETVEAAATVDFGNPDEIVAAPLDDGASPAPIMGEITAAPLDDTIAGAAAAIDMAAATPAAPPPAPASSNLSKPFIQIGIFSVEANATRTAEILRGDGLTASVRPGNSQGRAFWRVISGPAMTEADRGAALAKVKALGFTDAYFVTN